MGRITPTVVHDGNLTTTVKHDVNHVTYNDAWWEGSHLQWRTMGTMIPTVMHDGKDDTYEWWSSVERLVSQVACGSWSHIRTFRPFHCRPAGSGNGCGWALHSYSSLSISRGTASQSEIRNESSRIVNIIKSVHRVLFYWYGQLVGHQPLVV